MYHGEVLVMKDQLQSFLQTAEVLQVSGLIGCTNFPIKNVVNPMKQINKATKIVKPLEMTETPAKKPKLVTKTKVRNTPPLTTGVPNSPLSPKEQSNKIQSPVREKIEMVNVEKIKVEVEDDTKSSEDGETSGQSKVSEQQSILEAALEIRDNQPSILERSLLLSSSSKRNY